MSDCENPMCWKRGHDLCNQCIELAENPRRAQAYIKSLESQLAESWAENSAEVERLRAFRVAVLGWRTHNHPQWFCRRTAEMVADYGRAGEERAIQGGGK